MMNKVNFPPGSQMVNAPIAAKYTRALIGFLQSVFGAKENKNALAISASDKKVFNSSLTVGDTSLVLFDHNAGRFAEENQRNH